LPHSSTCCHTLLDLSTMSSLLDGIYEPCHLITTWSTTFPHPKRCCPAVQQHGVDKKPGRPPHTCELYESSHFPERAEVVRLDKVLQEAFWGALMYSEPSLSWHLVALLSRDKEETSLTHMQ
jgi:hypothetical protein